MLPPGDGRLDGVEHGLPQAGQVPASPVPVRPHREGVQVFRCAPRHVRGRRGEGRIGHTEGFCFA